MFPWCEIKRFQKKANKIKFELALKLVSVTIALVSRPFPF